MSRKMSGKVYLWCTDFRHPNKSDNDCSGELINVGGENGSIIETRLRCNNNKCQRVVTISVAELASLIEQIRQRRYQKSTKD